MHIERDLIVTAACGVQAFARIADRLRQRAFDIHVNIFQTDRKSEFFYLRCRFFLKAAAPQFHFCSFCCISARILSGKPNRLMKPSASA